MVVVVDGCEGAREEDLELDTCLVERAVRTCRAMAWVGQSEEREEKVELQTQSGVTVMRE